MSIVKLILLLFVLFFFFFNDPAFGKKYFGPIKIIPCPSRDILFFNYFIVFMSKLHESSVLLKKFNKTGLGDYYLDRINP